MALGYGPGPGDKGKSPSEGKSGGALGNGMGKWRFRVTSPQHIMVMSLIENTLTGHMKNMSTGTNH